MRDNYIKRCHKYLSTPDFNIAEFNRVFAIILVATLAIITRIIIENLLDCWPQEQRARYARI